MSTFTQDRTRVSPALAQCLGFNTQDRYTRTEVTVAFRDWLRRKGINVQRGGHLPVDEEVRAVLDVPPNVDLNIMNLNTYFWPHFMDFPQRMSQ